MASSIYNKLTQNMIEELAVIVGSKNVLTAPESLYDYGHDEFIPATPESLPHAVVKPQSTDQISHLMAFANKERIPVTPRGGGTGLCGGCVPAFGGIVLSLENMSRILEIDAGDMMIVAEAGVRLKDLYRAVDEVGLFLPPHPGDESAMVGGVIATNAGGARAVKYGVVRNFIRGVEVVTATGNVLNLGGKIIKNSTGYNLMHLMIGSEGTLGIVTKAFINLLPPPAATMTLIAPFLHVDDAVNAVPLMIENKILPMAVEFVERDVIDLSEKFSTRRWPCSEGNAYLMIMLDGSSPEEILTLAQKISRICSEAGAGELYVADTKKKQADILEFRSKLFEPIKSHTLEILDVSLPRRQVAAHLHRVRQISEEYSIWIPSYGHAADGNVHSHITRFSFRKGAVGDVHPDYEQLYRKIRPLIHEDAKARGGMISGEHGIGLAKKEYMQSFLGNDHIDAMKAIKRALDPNLILNPGKIFDLAI